MKYVLPHIMLILGLGITACSYAEDAPSPGAQLTIAPVGDVYGMFTRPIPMAGSRLAEPVNIRLSAKTSGGKAQKLRVSLTAGDVFGWMTGWKREVNLDLPADGRAVEQDVPFEWGTGYYTIHAVADIKGDSLSAETEIGIIPPPNPGIRKDSFFASNTSNLRTGQELEFLQMIGMKVERLHFQPMVALQGSDWVNKPSTGMPLELDFDAQDKTFAETLSRDTWVLPLVGYAFQNWGVSAKSEMAKRLEMHGPPRDFREFVSTWETILRHYPEVTTYEFWNEPWIFEWTWADTPERYRELQKMWCEMALKVNPNYRIVAGNSSMFLTDNIEHDPSCWKGLLQGTTHHPYIGCGNLNMRPGDQMRSMDDGMMTTRRMELPYYYLTEGGSQVEPKNGIENADKIVQYFVRTALVGAFQGNVQWEIGYGPGWTRSNTSYAVMTHFLEDRPIAADIWPEHELIYGAIFANPRHITPEVKALPRASELSVRWNVPVPVNRAADNTKVAVIWALMGKSNSQLDMNGKLTIHNAEGLKAYDMVGREISAKSRSLIVPFGSHPVYITTDALSVMELRQRIADGVISGVQPINMYALSLQEPADRSQTLFVRAENQLNREVRGTISLQVSGHDLEVSSPFTIPSGKLVQIPIEWPGIRVSHDNQYAVTLKASISEPVGMKEIQQTQVLNTARFAKRTIEVDADLSDWQGIEPLLLDSDMVKLGVDLTKYLMNPNLDKPVQSSDGKRIVARVYTAYDADNVYLAAAVNEDAYKCTAGTPVVMGKEKIELPYRKGMPNGLNHISGCGDAFGFAFGFRDRVPGWGRQMNDPYAWKGHFYDTDYQYVAHSSTDGDILMRQWGPHTGRRNAYQTEDVPGTGPVEGAQVRISRDEAGKLTTYEISIPRTELILFDPARKSCRFGFVLYNDEGLGVLNWSSAAGVFDYWQSSGSYSPTWFSTLPCQTFFGIEQGE